MERAVAVIGGGASGTLTTIRLVQKLYSPTVVYLIEKESGKLFRGAAYSSKLEYEPLNVACGRMSAFNHLPDNFFQWVRNRRDSTVHKESFVSRRWYGDYLHDTFNSVVARSTVARVEIITVGVTDITTLHAGNYCVHLSDSSTREVDFVILCTGNEEPQQILNEQERSLLQEQYVANPWLNNLDGLTGDEHVLILGTGLTMVDYVCSLYARRHAGKIYCLSRSGLMPLTHTEEYPFVPDSTFEGKGVKELFMDLRRNVKRAEEGRLNWQSVMDALRPRISRLWRRMSIEDRKLFLAKYRKWWDIHRHRMPENSHRIIKQMVKSGQLEILAGSYRKTEIAKPFAALSYMPVKGVSDKSLLLHRIINCTGPSGDYYQTDNSLIKGLLSKGWMQQDELKLGVTTGSRGEIINSRGIVLKNFYAVGPLRKAAEWESTAIREIRMHAEIVSDIVADAVATATEVLTVI